jgi:TolB-like protein/class 3 adenylate cyclase/Tfp pilus assembly protein PilF
MALVDQSISTRKLAAILSADVAGYSALMSADEEGTVRKLREVREAVLPVIERFGGRVIDLAGDGILAEFPSAVRAVESAAAVQSCMADLNAKSEPPMLFRIGVNVGDVIHEGERLYGDGINVAARLQALAQPGSICISNKVHEEVRDRVKLLFKDMGDQQLKNISRPVRAFSWVAAAINAKAPMHPALPDKPSIAVLPFQNISGDPEQDYFADGMVEDVITNLSRIKWLFVIARNSSFTYKGQMKDVKEIGRELGVRYVLEGSVRKAGNRVRITGQLIEASTGTHLWADRFDGAFEDVFELQDQVTSRVVGAIAPKLEQAEIERSKRKPTNNLDAYDYYLRGVDNLHIQTRSSTSEALRLFHRATELDREYASAYAMAAFCYSQRKAFGWVTERARDIAEAAPLARRAVELTRDDALALSRAGMVLAYVVEDFDAGALFIERARDLNPNLSAVWHASGWLKVWTGEPDTAIEHLERFVRISPLDPLLHSVWTAIAFAHVFAGRFAEAVSYAEKALADSPNTHQALRATALSCAWAGRADQARNAIDRLLEIDPTLRVSTLLNLTPLQRPQDIARYQDGMSKAGLPY